MMVEWIISILLLIGGCFVLVGSIGLMKMPDFFMRLHGPTKATTLPIPPDFSRFIKGRSAP